MGTMRRLIITVALAAVAGGLGLIAPTAAQAGPYCGITWGSAQKTVSGNPTPWPIINVRAGQHACFDRLVVDFHGSPSAYRVRYVSAVTKQGSGAVLPLRGGAFLQIDLQAATYDPNTGAATYWPRNPNELVNVSGWRTFRQVASGGSFEGYTTLGLGVRARLPFRVIRLTDPGRVVIDVAHRW
jgi:hypothetical protein